MRTLAHRFELRLFLGLLLAWTSTVAAHAAPAQSTLSNPRLGFELRVPDGWTAIPVKLDETWIVAKYMSERIFSYTNKENGRTYEERAEILVVRLAGGSDDAPSLDSYVDYLPTAIRYREHHVADSGSAKAGDLEAKTYEVRVQPSFASGERRVTAWEYELDGVRLAVHFDVPERGWRKLKSESLRCLRSLRAVEREAPAAASAEREAVIDDTPAARLEAAIASEEELHARAIESTPEGWESEMVGRVLVVSHDARTRGREFAEDIQAVFGWLDETFPEVGPEAYVRGPILRVCKDYDELSAIKQGTGTYSWAGSGLEILACKGHWGKSSGQVDVVQQRALEIWFRERDEDLYESFPRWISSGLRDLMADARTKRGKLQFKDDAWDRTELRDAVRSGTLSEVRDLVLLASADYRKVSTAYEQSGVLLAFLASKEARSKKLTKTLLADYFGHLADVVHEVRAEERIVEDAARAAKAAALEAGEEEGEAPELSKEERSKARREAYERRLARERRILDQTYQRTFGDWSEKNWKALEKAFLRSID